MILLLVVSLLTVISVSAPNPVGGDEMGQDELQVMESEVTTQSEVTIQYIEDHLTKSKSFLPNEPDSAITMVEELFLYDRVAQNDSLYAKAKYVAGVAYYYKDYYNLSIESYEEALATTYAVVDKHFRVRILNNLGVSHDNLKQHDDALHYYQLALQAEKERGDPAELSDMYINIGLVYYSIGDQEEALENFKTAQNLIEGLPVDHRNGLIQQNLGLVYNEMDLQEESREATEKAIEIFNQQNYHRGKLQCLNNLAAIYIDDLQDLERAETILNDAIEEAIEYDMPVQRAHLIIQLGRMEMLNENPAAALTYFNSVEAILKELDDPYTSYPLDLFETKLEAFARLGNTEGVMDTFREYEEIRKQRNLAEQTIAINELQLQLEVKENRSRMQEQTIELQEQRSRTQLFIYITSILAALLLGSLFFTRYRHKRLKKLYEINQRAVEKQKRLYRVSENQAKEKLTPVIKIKGTAEKEQNGPGELDPAASKEEAVGQPGEREEKPDRAERWIFNKVNDLVDKESLHKDPNLSLSALSTKAGISSRAVSKSINYYSGLSFNHFINEFRVMDAMEDLKDESKNHLSLESILADNGFASRSTFYSAFDKVSGMTPNQYRKISQQEKDLV